MTGFQRRVQILEKIMRTGARTEKELLSLSLEQLLQMEDITILDLRDLLEVQRQVKAHTLFSWLCAEPEKKVEAPEELERQETFTANSPEHTEERNLEGPYGGQPNAGGGSTSSHTLEFG